MKIRLFALLLVALIGAKAVAQTQYAANLGTSKLVWLARKATGSHTGTVQLATGEFTIDAKNTLVACRFEADMSSIKTTDISGEQSRAKLDGILRGEGFFEAAKFARATFVLAQPAAIVKGAATVKGQMTIKNHTAPVELKATFQETADGLKVSGQLVLDRRQYDLHFGTGSFLENMADKAISDQFFVNLYIVGLKK